MSRFVTLAVLAVLSTACSDGDPLSPYVPEAGPLGLRVVENRVEDAEGRQVILRGVNRSGTEYQCTKDFGDGKVRHFDGPSDADSIDAIASWPGVNAVRVPLNEHCWLGVEGMPALGTVDAYRRSILDYVALLQSRKLTPILDLHWVGAGSLPADRLEPLPDAEHAVAFWRSVATTFKNDPNVVFEPFNEPFPNGNGEGELAWQAFRDGGLQLVGTRRGQPATGETYLAVGMQALVDAIRSTGARHLILVGGIQYSNDLERWLDYRPQDPLGNLGAAWHIYDKNPCRTEECWNRTVAPVAAAVPLVTTELGEQDCDSVFVEPLLHWLDRHASGYLAWSWNAYGACNPPGGPQRPNPWSLITDYQSGTPNGAYAQAYFDHLSAIAP